MMFGQFPEETQNLLDQAATHPYDPTPPDAGFFHNVGGDIPSGYKRGGAELMLLGTDAIAGVDKWAGAEQPSSTLTDWHNASLNVMSSLQPDPHTVGMAGRLLGGLTQAAPAMAGGFAAGGPVGMAAAVGTTAGYTDFRMGQSQGLDTTTAAEKGLLTGVTSAAGAVLPAGVGTGALVKIGTGALGNIAFGAGQREATSALLNARGYTDMAQQYKPLDKAALLADGVMGAAFGGAAALHGSHVEQPAPAMVDAAMMAKNAQSLEVDSAPGVPLDAATRSNHLQAINTATDQLLNDKTVDLSGIATADMHFAPDGTTKLNPDPVAFKNALNEAGFEHETPKVEGEPAKIDTLRADFDKNTSEVRALNDRMQQIIDEMGKVLTVSDKIELVNPEAAAKLKTLEVSLQDPNLAPEAAAQMQIQRQRIIDTTKQDGVPDAVAERQQRLQDQATELQGQLAEKQASLSAAEKQLAKSTPEATPYQRIPRKPIGLADWVRKQGGLKDEGGDVKAMIGKAKYRPGLINKKGRSADNLALAAMENGYFPEKGGERPSQNEFLDKLGEDLGGNAQHSDHDAAALQAYHQALAHNDEIDKIAGQYGIETAGKTSAQLFEEVSQHMSDEERLQQADDMAASHRKDLLEAQKLHKAWLASRGEAWEPNIHDRGRRATLEDLENEREQENIAAGSLASESVAGGSRDAGRGEGAVQERGRQGGAEPNAAAEPREPGSDNTATGAIKKPGEYETNAEQIVAENPHMPIVTGEVDKDGNPEIITAREAMAREDLLDKNNEIQKRVVQAAVNCFLRWG